MKLPDGYKNNWRVGEKAYFEYHCNMSKQSQDYPAWQHSHQTCKVLGVSATGYGRTFMERGHNGEPRVYRVKFADGLKWDVFEDELMTSPRHYSRRFDPPIS